MLTKASMVTMARIALVPIFMWALLAPQSYANTLALIIFIIASLTDWVDGFLARRYNQVTTFGKFIDPLADKLLITSAMLVFVQQGRLASWAAMLIISREFIITSLRTVAVSAGKVIAADVSGKIKTLTQVLCVIFFMVIQTEPLFEISGLIITNDSIAGLVMVAVTLWSGIDYLVRHGDVLNYNA